MVRQPTARPTPSRTRVRAVLDRAPADARRVTAASDRMRAALPWLVLWTAAFGVRLTYVIELRDAPIARILIGDALAYDAWARAIAAGDWLGHEVFYQAPLYPYFLGA